MRTLAYRSGDPNLIQLFEKKVDVYVHTAREMLGNDKWEKFDKLEKKKWRKVFKQVFLAVAYRMSARTLGNTLNVPEQEAQGYVDALFAQFPTLKKFIDENAAYPLQHNGYINTELGDTLRCSSWRYLYTTDLKTGDKKIDRRIVSKLDSAGINYRIQSFSALSLASGFENVQQKAIEENKLIRNIIVVHDSCENLFDINLLFEIRQFYDKNFLEHCKNLYGISFNYDLEVGLSYGEMLGVTTVDEKTIKVSGTGSIILELLRKIREESDLEVSCDLQDSQIQPLFEMCPAKRFIKEHQCCLERDESFYTVTLTKLN